VSGYRIAAARLGWKARSLLGFVIMTSMRCAGALLRFNDEASAAKWRTQWKAVILPSPLRCSGINEIEGLFIARSEFGRAMHANARLRSGLFAMANLSSSLMKAPHPQAVSRYAGLWDIWTMSSCVSSADETALSRPALWAVAWATGQRGQCAAQSILLAESAGL
jgi:hypothetical protein